MDRAELEYVIREDVKKKSIRWGSVVFINNEVELLLKKLTTKQQFNYLEIKRGLQLNIAAIDEVLKKHEQNT